MTPDDRDPKPGRPVKAGSRVDAGPTTEAGPLGRVDPKRPETAPPGTVPRPKLSVATGTVVLGFVGLIVTLLVFGTIADGVREQEVFALDTWATPFLHGISSPLLDTVMNATTSMGSSLVVLPIFAAVAVALVLRRRYGALLFLSVALAGSLVIDFVMKLVFQRPRPKLDYASVLPDYSFPSGHSMNGVVFYVSLALVAWSVFGRRIGLIATAAAAILAIAIGISRIYLGYHYLTDVVGGWLAGIAWLTIVGSAFRVRPQVWAWGSRSAPAGSGTRTTARPAPRVRRRGGQP